MTYRYSNLSEIWASDGVATDPDLDTEHPAYTPGKFLLGWIVEREPHQWQNYLYQSTDLKMQIIASEQFVGWEDGIEYQPNAVVRLGDSLYRNKSANTVSGTSPDASSDWELVLIATTEEHFSIVNGMVDALVKHVTADNPHNNNIHQIGGYESGEIDNFFGSPTDIHTIVYHKLQTGAVHSENVEQIGTLPVSGGTFTGDVIFEKGLNISGANIGKYGTEQIIGNDKGFLYLDDKYAYSDPQKGLIVTEANFVDVEMAVNNMFALPPPVCIMDFRQGCFSQISPGRYYLEYSNQQSFEENKGWVIANGVSIHNLINNDSTTSVFEYYIGDVRKIIISDDPVLNSNSLSQLSDLFDTNATHFTRLVVYPRLTKYQKSNIYAQT